MRLPDRLKSLPLTIILTVLIWMYAEAQFTSVQPDVKINVQVIAPSPDLTLRVHDMSRDAYTPLMNLVVTLQGPRDQIDRIYNDSLQLHYDQASEGLAYVPTPNEVSQGKFEISTVSILNRMPYFRDRNVTVTSASPARVTLEVDPVRQIKASVTFPQGTTVQTYSLEPSSVDVFVAQSTWEKIGEGHLTVIAEPGIQLGTLPQDTEQRVPVRFVAEYSGTRDDRIRINPSQGNVTVHTRRSQPLSETIPDVPIWVSGPPAMLARFDVELQPRALSVNLAGNKGPIDDLHARLAAGGVKATGVYIYLDITAEDQPSDALSRRRLRFILPEGLSLLSGTNDVSYRLVERNAPPSTATVPATKTGN